jgi:hypothetical protein
MSRILLFCRFATIVLVCAVVAHQAVADPPIVLRDYRFIPSESSVDVTGGIADYDLKLTVAGTFGLVTGYEGEATPVSSAPQPPELEPFAQFVNVHGILYNPLSATPSPTPGWDLDKTLNMSGWTGTFSPDDPNQLFFLGADGQGVAMRVEATIEGGWLQITGGSSDPIGSKPVLYQIDALAHLLPFPDLNGDGAVTAADVVAMQQALTDPQAYEAQHDLSSADFLALGDVNGDGVVNNADLQALLNDLKSNVFAEPVPEPPAGILLALSLPALILMQFCQSKMLRRRKFAVRA